MFTNVFACCFSKIYILTWTKSIIDTNIFFIKQRKTYIKMKRYSEKNTSKKTKLWKNGLIRQRFSENIYFSLNIWKDLSNDILYSFYSWKDLEKKKIYTTCIFIAFVLACEYRKIRCLSEFANCSHNNGDAECGGNIQVG